MKLSIQEKLEKIQSLLSKDDYCKDILIINSSDKNYKHLIDLLDIIGSETLVYENEVDVKEIMVETGGRHDLWYKNLRKEWIINNWLIKKHFNK